MTIELRSGEQLLADVAANMFRGVESVGGRMRITDKRILFEPHSLNLQKQPAEIPLEQVTEVGKSNTMGFIPNGLFVHLQSGLEYKFVCWQRERLISLIQKHISKV
jgi:hypothetical protein